jgi:hypothetical protein
MLVVGPDCYLDRKLVNFFKRFEPLRRKEHKDAQST